MRDRRSGEERRAANRYQVQLDVQWQGVGQRAPGTLSDVSLDGCFVLCTGEVEDGENVKIFVPLADGMNVEFRGRVTNHVNDIGFGMKFDSVSAAQRDLLVQLVRASGQS